MKIKLILFLIVFSLIPFINASVGYGEIDYGINYKTPPIEFNNNTAFVNASQWWVTSDYGPLDAISDISHSWLSGLAWSVAGHTIDTTLDMNNNDIDDIKNLNGSGNFTTTGDITARRYNSRYLLWRWFSINWIIKIRPNYPSNNNQWCSLT